MTATTMISAMHARPKMPVGAVRNARRIFMARSARSRNRARIDDRERDVHDRVHGDNHASDHEDDCLHYGIVLLVERLHDGGTQTHTREDVLDDKRATHEVREDEARN